MINIVYLHGFLSSPDSFKSRATERWLAEHYPDIRFHSPVLSSYPDEALVTLEAYFSHLDSANTYVLGSSLGGYWASYVIEQGMANKAVIINPAVSPHLRFTHYIDRPLKSFYSEDVYTLNAQHLKQLESYEHAVLRDPERYWLMVQKGDEVLDYRMACQRYALSKQLVEEDGNHSFEHYENWLPDIYTFFLA